MKKCILLFIALSISSCVFAQTPRINYQAVLRDVEGQPIANENLTLVIEITDADDQQMIYKETHNVSTKDLGLVQLVIGEGTATIGSIDGLKARPRADITIRATIGDATQEVELASGPLGGEVTWSAFTLNGTSTLNIDQVNITMMADDDTENQIVYGTMAGPEAAAYDRGIAKLVNGEPTVYCPDHFQAIAEEGSMTVTVTPLSAESLGIAVIEKTAKGFKVKELYGGTGNYGFDYMVMFYRKMAENYKVIQKQVEPTKIVNTELLQVQKDTIINK